MGYGPLGRELWLTLSRLPTMEKLPPLDVPISPQGLFGAVMEQMREKFEVTQKRADALKTFLPRREASTVSADLYCLLLPAAASQPRR